MEHRPSLDGVRGVAVAAVVVYHFAPGVLPAGFLGVDLFFVLSGFLITTLLVGEHHRRSRIDLTAFWGRRVRRLLPAALLALLLIVAISVRTGQVGSGLPGDLLATLGYVNNWHQIATNQSYFALFGAPSPTKHFWSLAIEEQFYLVWPVLVIAGFALLGRRRGRRHVAGLVLGLAIAASSAAMWWLFSTNDDPTRAYYGTDTRAFELLVGALLAVVVRPALVRRRRSLTVAGAVAAVACGVAMFRWSQSSAAYYRGGALLWAVGAAVLIVAVLPEGPLASAFSLRPVAALGLISYGVYLFHWPIGLWLDGALPELAASWLFVVKVGATLVLATLSYVIVEIPIRRRRVLATGVRARIAAPVAIGATALLVLVLVVPLTPAAEVDLATAEAGSGPPPSDLVISAASVDTTPPGPPPGESEHDWEAILKVAAYDQQLKEATANPTVPPPWTPPPPPPLMSYKQAQLQADISLVNSCAGRSQPPLAEYRDNGTGKLVAVIGDSMTAQMHDMILRDRSYDWFLIARCGTSVHQFRDLTPGTTAGLPEVFAKLLFMQPKAMIVALGITDASRRLTDVPESLQTFLDLTKDVPCRSWVTLWPNEQMNRTMPGLQDQFVAFDEALADATRGSRVRLLDWGSRVGAVPISGAGYHPWLNPTDWVHLLPGQAFEQRWALMKSGLDGCLM